MEPLLKYPGGKSKSVPLLKEAFEIACRHRRLTDRPIDERFFGGGALSFALESQEVQANDICLPVVNFYRQVKKGLDLSIIKMQYDKSLYLNHRERFNSILKKNEIEGPKSAEAAALLFFLSRTCFNGLIRFSGDEGMGFNVGFGSYKQVNYQRDFEPYRNLMKRWNFSSQDFALGPVDPDAAIFMDPPYDSVSEDKEDPEMQLSLEIGGLPCQDEAKTGKGFVKYAGNNFGWSDQERVVQFATSFPNPVVITNKATPRIVKLYEDYGLEVHFYDARRSIACNGDRGPSRDVIAIKKEHVFSLKPKSKQRQPERAFSNP
ncbi:MAG TPA: DNA adenine methylase [Leptolyngbyaceae cyanobacterium]